MTYLELVNNVLLRLREEEVTTVNQEDYSKLVGGFVNDAISTVEASWDWSCLREELYETITKNSHTTVLQGVNSRCEIMSVYNATKKSELNLRPKSWIMNKHYVIPENKGSVRDYAINGTSPDNELKLITYPSADEDTVIAINVVLRDNVLDSDSDKTKLPPQPIIQLAFALALRERGETGGQGAMEQIAVAQQSLSDAIALDAGLNAGEMVFGVV